MSVERGLLGCAGIGMALVGGLFLTTFLVTLLSGEANTEPGVLAGLIVFFGGMLATGLFVAWRMFRHRPLHSHGVGRPAAAHHGHRGHGPARRVQPQAGFGAPSRPSASQPPPPPQTDDERERSVLRFAESEHGRVTVAEVATGCNMSLADAKATLDRLVILDVSEIRVTQNGVLVYVFPGFLSDEEKAQATDF